MNNKKNLMMLFCLAFYFIFIQSTIVLLGDEIRKSAATGDSRIVLPLLKSEKTVAAIKNELLTKKLIPSSELTGLKYFDGYSQYMLPDKGNIVQSFGYSLTNSGKSVIGKGLKNIPIGVTYNTADDTLFILKILDTNSTTPKLGIFDEKGKLLETLMGEKEVTINSVNNVNATSGISWCLDVYGSCKTSSTNLYICVKVKVSFWIGSFTYRKKWHLGSVGHDCDCW